MEIRLILLVGLLVPTFSFLGLDTLVSSSLYSPESGWTFGDRLPWRILYAYGEIPAYAAAFLSAALLIRGCIRQHAARYRRFSLYCLLALLIGPVLIVNVILKDHWGRPRPRQVDSFGGNMVYQYVWQPGETGRGKSFPCGHAAAGFFLIAPYFALRHRRPGVARTFLTVGICYGSLMGMGRIAQGGHFLSDVIGSGVIVYAVGLSLSNLLGLGRSAQTGRAASAECLPMVAEGEAQG